MTEYQSKPVKVKAITFDELEAYGEKHGPDFSYGGMRVTRTDVDCYRVGGMQFARGNMLITEPDGHCEIYGSAGDLERTYGLIPAISIRISIDDTGELTVTGYPSNIHQARKILTAADDAVGAYFLDKARDGLLDDKGTVIKPSKIVSLN